MASIWRFRSCVRLGSFASFLGRTVGKYLTNLGEWRDVGAQTESSIIDYASGLEFRRSDQGFPESKSGNP